MKKIMVALLMAALFAGVAFAGEGFTASVDLVTDVLSVKSYSGDYAESDSTKPNEDYQGAGDFGVFGTSLFDGAEARATFKYTDDNYGATLQLRADNGVRSTTPQVHLGDYEAWLKFGGFKLLAGNTAERGKVARLHDDFDDFVSFKVDNYGLTKPNANGTLQDTDTANIMKESFGYTTGGLLAQYTFAPVTISAELGGIFYSTKTVTAGNVDPNGKYYDDDDKVTNFGVRVDVEKIADFVTFSAIYKYSGIESVVGGATEVTTTNGVNDLGVYANLFVVDGFVIGLGYSAQFGNYKVDGPSPEITYGGPFWSGVDLRLAFTGIDNLTLRLNNNASFTSVTGSDSATESISGLYNGDTNFGGGKDDTAAWFALYNALAAAYKVDDKLTINAQVANRLAIATYESKPVNDVIKDTYTTDSLGVYAGVVYAVAPTAKIRGGIALKNVSFEAKTDASGAPTQPKYGTFTFGIPLGMKIEW